jgi:uncharacterized protein (TIGR02996 family)
MREEPGFLASIRSAPADDTARLVYADWLEEQADPHSNRKATFLRLELDIRNNKGKSLRVAGARARLRLIAAQLDPEWLAVVSHPALENCQLRFEFECPKEWSALQPTEEAHVRFCESCKRKVHYCSSIDDARTRAWRGECVALSLGLVRSPGDVNRPILAGAIRLTPDMITRLGRVRPNGARTVDISDDPDESAVRGPEQQEPEPTPPPRRGQRRQSRSRQRHIERQDWDQ